MTAHRPPPTSVERAPSAAGPDNTELPFVRNAWYVAAWADDLGDEPQRIRILDEWVALFRRSNGGACAIGDICPHRFASLSQGRVVEDGLQCPYHGLRYDADGVCRHNPHGDGAIPPRARVKSYPLVERHGALWIWMGEQTGADAATIPDLSMLDAPGIAVARGYLPARANVELILDNLMDLTHAEFLHPFLLQPGATARSRHEVRQTEGTVQSLFVIDDQPITPIFDLIWDRPDRVATFRSNSTWIAPATIYIDSGMTPIGEDEASCPAFPGYHLLTPETATTTHYFWAVGRNRRLDDAGLQDQIREGIQFAFSNEDEPMIARVQSNMDGNDFWALQPAILTTDRPAVRVRRILQRMRRDEAAATSCRGAIPDPAADTPPIEITLGE